MMQCSVSVSVSVLVLVPALASVPILVSTRQPQNKTVKLTQTVKLNHLSQNKTMKFKLPHISQNKTVKLNLPKHSQNKIEKLKLPQLSQNNTVKLKQNQLSSLPRSSFPSCFHSILGIYFTYHPNLYLPHFLLLPASSTLLLPLFTDHIFFLRRYYIFRSESSHPVLFPYQSID